MAFDDDKLVNKDLDANAMITMNDIPCDASTLMDSIPHDYNILSIGRNARTISLRSQYLVFP